MALKEKTISMHYKNEKEMDKEVAKMEKNNWKVVSVQELDGEYKAGKTCCLGCLFLPLALLGKKKGGYRVVFKGMVEA